MTARFSGAIPAAFAAIALLSAFQAPRPEDDFAALAKAYLALGLPADWEAIATLPGFKWAPLPPTSLANCLPNGDCYARQGTTTVARKNLTVVASGARTMVMNLLIRNLSAPFGGPAVVAALERAGLTVELARCPVRSGVPGTSWYRIKGENLGPAVLSIQPAATGRPNEGFVVSRGEELPALQPAQLALYSEQCAPGAERKPVSTILPHEALAQTVVALLVPAGGPALHDWKALTARSTEIRWLGNAPKAADLRALGDPNPMMLSGEAAYSGRKFTVMATGSASEVKVIRLDEQGRHRRGEHMLGEVYKMGIAVRLVRCGPIYTESTNNWYSLASARTRPAHIRQSIHYDGEQVADGYELRLDGTLPPRDPRDRDPGRNGCQ